MDLIESLFIYKGSVINITVTSSWVLLRLKSPASRVFAQPFVRVHIEENIEVPRHLSV